MAHQRTNVRNAIVSALVSSGVAGGNIVVGRVYPADQTTLPAVGVHTPEDDLIGDGEMVPVTGGVLQQDRELTVAIEVVDEGADYLDKLDVHALAIETALNADLGLGGAAHYTWYESTAVERSDELEQPAGRMVIGYRVQYRVDGRNLESNI